MNTDPVDNTATRGTGNSGVAFRFIPVTPADPGANDRLNQFTPKETADAGGRVTALPIRCETGGDVVILSPDGHKDTLKFKDGETRWVYVARVFETGTTATGIEIGIVATLSSDAHIFHGDVFFAPASAPFDPLYADRAAVDDNDKATFTLSNNYRGAVIAIYRSKQKAEQISGIALSPVGDAANFTDQAFDRDNNGGANWNISEVDVHGVTFERITSAAALGQDDAAVQITLAEPA